MKSELFKPYRISDRESPNRLVAQAMEVNSAEPGGAVSEMVLNRYRTLAEGRWGIVFVEATSVTEKHVGKSNGLVLSRKNLDGFKQLVEDYKNIDDSCLLMIQLTHSGRQSVAPQRVKVYEDEETDIPIVTEKELEEVLQDHIDAAGLAREAGFDGVDIKSCHGYLGAELLRPLNQRKDKFGGSVENRAYLIASAIESAVRDNPGLIVGTRMSAYEGLRGGCGTAGPEEILEDFTDIKKIAGIFVDAGARFLNITGGTRLGCPQLIGPKKNDSFCRLSQFRYTRQFKEWFPDTALIGSTYSSAEAGSILSAEENISKGYTDFAGFGRQNLADPEFPRKISEGEDTIKFCKLCGRCSKLLADDLNIFCAYHNPENPFK